MSNRIQEARSILVDLDLPRGQLYDRTALCLLALLDMQPSRAWKNAESPLMGITPIMDWAKSHYKRTYAPNTRETFRRQSMHQFIEAGICLYNPDKLSRSVNSPGAVYQIEPNLLSVLKTFGTSAYKGHMRRYLGQRTTLAQRYAQQRAMQRVPVRTREGKEITLSAGQHSVLIRAIIEGFIPRFVPGGFLVYVGDTGAKQSYFDQDLLAGLGVSLDRHGKLPDVIVNDANRHWLFLIESVTSHGPVDHKRRLELSDLFHGCSAGLVYVSAFPDRKMFLRYLGDIAWETEVWLSDSPEHMVHFNGSRFLGPY